MADKCGTNGHIFKPNNSRDKASLVCGNCGREEAYDPVTRQWIVITK